MSVCVSVCNYRSRESGNRTWHGNTGGTRSRDKRGGHVVGTGYLCIKFSKHNFLETLEKINA